MSHGERLNGFDEAKKASIRRTFFQAQYQMTFAMLALFVAELGLARLEVIS